MNERHQLLFDKYFDGSLSPAEKVEMAQRLDQDPEFREEFLRFVEEADDIAQLMAERREEDARPRRHHRPLPLALAAGLVVAAGLTFVFWPGNRSAPRQAADESGYWPGLVLPSSVGQVTSGTLRVAGRRDSMGPGDPVPLGRVFTEDEAVTIQLDSGCAVALFAQSEVDFLDPGSLRLHQGRVTGKTGSPAHELTLVTPELVVTDLGTSFGAERDRNGVTEVHVLDGTVRISGDHIEGRMLGEGQAVRSEDGKTLMPVPARKRQFGAEFPPPPSTLTAFVHYGFETSAGNRFEDTGRGFAAGPFPLIPRRKADPPQLIQGRFGPGIAMDQRNTLESDFPGIAGDRPRTVSLWFKAGDFRRVMGLVGWGASTKSQKWQTGLWHDPDRDKLVARTEFGEGYVISPLNLADGEWHHFVSVYLGGNEGAVEQRIRHYLDGRLQPVHAFKTATIIDTDVTGPRAHSVQVGRHLEKPSHYNFTGFLDEVYVFDRALNPGEIRELHLHNRPPEKIAR